MRSVGAEVSSYIKQRATRPGKALFDFMGLGQQEFIKAACVTITDRLNKFADLSAKFEFERSSPKDAG
jgi:hypothetical protein